MEQHAAPAQHLQPQEIFSPAASASVPGPQQLQPSTPATPGLTTHLPLPSLVRLAHVAEGWLMFDWQRWHGACALHRREG